MAGASVGWDSDQVLASGRGAVDGNHDDWFVVVQSDTEELALATLIVVCVDDLRFYFTEEFLKPDALDHDPAQFRVGFGENFSAGESFREESDLSRHRHAAPTKADLAQGLGKAVDLRASEVHPRTNRDFRWNGSDAPASAEIERGERPEPFRQFLEG